MNDVHPPTADARAWPRKEPSDFGRIDRPPTKTGLKLFAWGTLVFLCLALGIGSWQHYRLHAQVMATTELRRDFVPSVRTESVRASPSTIAVTWPGTIEAFAQ